MRVLGLSAHFHDSAAALVEDGRIVAAVEEERLSRRKHEPRLPVEAARFCVHAASSTMAALDWVVFHEKPLLKFERLLLTQLREFPRALSSLPRMLSTWLGQRLWQGRQIARALGVPEARVLFSAHHLSHAASAFFPSPFAEACVLTVDGVGEHATTAIWRGQGTTLSPLGELEFPHSIGLFYSALTAYLGFAVNDGEYKVMGLAAYGEPRFLPELRRIARVGADGSLSLDLDYFRFHYHPEQSFSPALEALLGPARRPGSELEPERGEGARLADVAASLQRFTEDYLLALAREAHRRTGLSRLALAGGVALNCVANRRLLAEGPFEELFVQPAAGDAGGALGAALAVSHLALGQPRGAPLGSAELGPAFTAAEVERTLAALGAAPVRFASEAELDEAVCARLARGAIGGWVQGRAEWGPRALGARSILADPRDPTAKERVNRRIKQREAFRPFAPAVLEDELERWFLPVAGRADHALAFMCSASQAAPGARDRLPAVIHADGSARVGLVSRRHQPRFSALLERWRAHSGVGVLLNTSLNVDGEPICNSPAEAYSTFLRAGLDFLAIGPLLVERRERA